MSVKAGTVRLTVGRTLCVLVCGDVTTQQADAIVNAANSGLQGGGGCATMMRSSLCSPNVGPARPPAKESRKPLKFR